MQITVWTDLHGFTLTDTVPHVLEW